MRAFKAFRSIKRSVDPDTTHCTVISLDNGCFQLSPQSVIFVALLLLGSLFVQELAERQPTGSRRPSTSLSSQSLDLFRSRLPQLASRPYAPIKSISRLIFAPYILIFNLSQKFFVSYVAPNVSSNTPQVLFHYDALGDVLHVPGPAVLIFMSHARLAMG